MEALVSDYCKDSERRDFMGKGRLCGDLANSVFLQAFVIVRIWERLKVV